MTYDYFVAPEHNLLVIVGSGSISSADIYRVVTAFQKDPEWNPGMNMLVDWRRVTGLEIDLDQVRQLASVSVDGELQKLGTPLGPRAAVLIANFDYESIPKVYAGYLRKSGLQTKVTYRADEAAEWLGLETIVVHTVTRRGEDGPAV